MNSAVLKRKKLKTGMVEQRTIGSRITQLILMLVVGVLAVICLLPMWHVLMSSISDGFELVSHKGLVLWPIGDANLEGYKLVFKDAGILKGYLNTLIYVAGTVSLGFVINVLGGYALSRKTKLGAVMMVYLIVPLMFGGGMIPQFMVMKSLGLVGTRLPIILIEATMGIYVVMGSMAFRSVPASTVEAARIDGAGHFRVMFQVMFPQCRGMFTVTMLMTFVGSWNSWLTAAIYVPGNRDLWPVQLWIKQIIADNDGLFKQINPNYSQFLVQFAVIAAATIPMMIAIPFFSKQIEAGVITGGVKE